VTFAFIHKIEELADKFGMAGLASTAIHSASDLSFWHRITLLIVGIFALVLASRSLVRVLRITHGLAWNARVPKLQKPTRAALDREAAGGFVGPDGIEPSTEGGIRFRPP